MILYHGTLLESAQDIVANGIRLEKCRDYTDFGAGFYTTLDKTFAEACAQSKADFYENLKKLALVQFEVNWEKVRGHLFFPKADIEWGQFIINNRASNSYINKMNLMNIGKNNRNSQYPIVQGPTADARITDLVREYDITKQPVKEEDMKRFKSSVYGEQISFHTEIALSLLTNAKIIEVERRIY